MERKAICSACGASLWWCPDCHADALARLTTIAKAARAYREACALLAQARKDDLPPRHVRPRSSDVYTARAALWAALDGEQKGKSGD